MLDEQHTRRRVILSTGALAAGTIGVVTLGSNNATATVDGEFSIPNGETILADQSLTDVRLSADVSYQYTANAPLHGLELELHVGAASDTLDLIARHERGDLAKAELSGEETLNGSLMSASDFDIEDFQPSGGELRRTVVAELRFYALRNGEVVADATQNTTFDVIVKDEALQVDVTLGGTGTVAFEKS